MAERIGEPPGHPTYHGSVSAPPDLAGRYGTPNRLQRRLVVGVVAVLAAALLGWTAWTVTVHAAPAEVQAQLTGYRVLGQHRVAAQFTVTRRSAPVVARCTLQAFASDHAVVGQITVQVGPGRPVTESLSRAIRTERAATGVDLVGCVPPAHPSRR